MLVSFKINILFLKIKGISGYFDWHNNTIICHHYSYDPSQIILNLMIFRCLIRNMDYVRIRL